MKLSQYLLPILRQDQVSKEATSRSHFLMIQAGIIHQISNGLYDLLPIGYKIIRKIENIVQNELDKINAHRISMPIVQPKEFWNESGRFDYCGDETLQIKDRHKKEYFFSPTNEEITNDIIRNYVKSYKQLPICLYQINWKFRDEIRPRFGLMRAREFLMMDAYSFHLTKICAEKTYNDYLITYLKIFQNCGLKAIPMKADSGPIGGDLSHEFLVLAETGESKVYYDSILDNIDINNTDINQLRNIYAVTEDKYNDNKIPKLEGELKQARAIEVGHIFYVGSEKYSKTMNVSVPNDKGEKVLLEMCTYGIGITRLMAAIIEASNDNKGIIWPESVAPFDVILINLDSKNQEISAKCEEIYNKLKQHNVDILYDDTDKNPGEKFAIADLIGIPKQIIIGKKYFIQNQAEIIYRSNSKEKRIVDFADILNC